MQAQTTRTFGQNSIIGTAIGIGLLAASVLGIATLTDSVELPSLGSDSTTIERRIEAPLDGQSYSFREANLYHPGFESRPVARPAVETAFVEQTLALPGIGIQAAVRPALETAFIEQNLALPGVDSQAIARPVLETVFIEANTVLPEIKDQAVVQSALETVFLEWNLALPEYQERGEVPSTAETAFIESNTLLHPESSDADDAVEVKANQPS